MSTLEFPKGMITPYYPPDPYNIVAPKGWSICDGTNGTPDLRGRFIRGYDFENSSKFDSVGGKDGYFITDENQKKNSAWTVTNDRMCNMVLAPVIPNAKCKCLKGYNDFL